jgi:glyoxylase-like metal-dependent hydrolase (beta-lactamase superfamily II)
MRLAPFLAALLVAISSLVSAQEDWDAVKIETVSVKDGIYMLVGRGGNIGLSVGEDGAFLIDDQYAPLTAKIETAIRAVTKDPVRFLVNTHWHGDHTGGNENFGKTGSIIVAHENVRRRMGAEQVRRILSTTKTPASPAGALPRVTFSDEVTFHWNGDEIRAFHVDPAHTDTDSIIHFVKADVVHMGDVFVTGRYPFVDVDTGGNVNGIIAAADKVLLIAKPTTKIIPGHGDLSGPPELQAYRNMLASVRDRVKTLVDGGKSVEEVIAAKPTSSFEAKLGADSERFVRGVYHSVKR